jgi:FkbM family methyltransferase
MISYAQNAEDVVLARLFRRQDTGHYIDVGAGHPVDDSVTKHFYDAGWRGINVEPMAREAELLCQERPEDVNISAALSDRTGEATLYEAPPENRGSSTLSQSVAQRYANQEFVPVTVELTTLTEVWRRHPIGDIDFLKIDAEGHEEAVIRGGPWDRLRPRVLVIEATEPNSTTTSHEAWEPLLLECNYRCALFDGLNRFYAQEDDDEALTALSVPANVHDGFDPWRWVREIDGANEHAKNVEAARATAETWAGQLEDEVRGLATEARALDPLRPTNHTE